MTNNWIEWNGGEQPVGDDVRVETIDRDGYRETVTARRTEWHWDNTTDADNIVKYRIVKDDEDAH